jgi:nitroimidazol reductase NimA-like FMN-containing flavoprotein (pyridoxamine 5'-phosphate oxidase superfamily)
MIRDLEKSEMEALLCSELIGRLGCYANGRLYVVPMGYAYVDGEIIGHSGQGRKVDMMRENPYVCFEVEHVNSLADWRSVILWGVYQELSGAEAGAALNLLVGRLSPLDPSFGKPIEDGPDGASTRHRISGPVQGIVFQIAVDAMTGRREKR